MNSPFTSRLTLTSDPYVSACGLWAVTTRELDIEIEINDTIRNFLERISLTCLQTSIVGVVLTYHYLSNPAHVRIEFPNSWMHEPVCLELDREEWYVILRDMVYD